MTQPSLFDYRIGTSVLDALFNTEALQHNDELNEDRQSSYNIRRQFRLEPELDKYRSPGSLLSVIEDGLLAPDYDSVVPADVSLEML